MTLIWMRSTTMRNTACKGWQEQGCFTEQGYLSCQGEQSLEELLWEAGESQKPAEPEMQMGGW